MEQQIQKEKRMEQKEIRKNCRLDKPAEIARIDEHDPGRIADSWSMCAGCGKGYPENLSQRKQNRWHARLALGDGQNSNDYWT